MIDLESLQDIANLGAGHLLGMGRKSPELPEWILELFDKYDIEDSDMHPLGGMIFNLSNYYMKDQEITEGSSVELLRNMVIHELIYHYIHTLQFRKFVGVQPMAQPASLVFYLNKDNGSDTPTISQTSVSAYTRTSTDGIDMLFSHISDEIIEKLLKSLDDPVTVPLSNLRNYLEESTYESVVYDDVKVAADKSFKLMASNGIIISSFENFNKNTIEVTGCLPMDEILLTNHKSDIATGLIFAPYIVPLRTCKLLKNGKTVCNSMSRYGVFASDDINSWYKRVKITN